MAELLSRMIATARTSDLVAALNRQMRAYAERWEAQQHAGLS